MISNSTNDLKLECLGLLHYYLRKTSSIINLYQDTAEIHYFLFALKGTNLFIASQKNIDKPFLNKCINSLIAGQKEREDNDHLNKLKKELEEELQLLKLRFDLD